MIEPLQVGLQIFTKAFTQIDVARIELCLYADAFPKVSGCLARYISVASLIDSTMPGQEVWRRWVAVMGISLDFLS